MRTITPEELKEIRNKHRKWLNNEEGGERANLEGTNLQWANLQWADLQCANLREANLQGAYLVETNLQEANLRDANLKGAILIWADLREAYLGGADLSLADLRGANLEDADLRGVNLRGAVLRGAVLQGANLGEGDLHPTLFSPYYIIPEKGKFIAWKKLANDKIAKIEIPASAKRICIPTSRKCRANKIKILEIYNANGSIYNGKNPIRNWRLSENPLCIYEKSKTYTTDLNEDIREECTEGFHFFVTRTEAEKWKG